MKRILLFTSSLGSGGAERQLCFLSVFLKQKGYTVKVITYAERLFFKPYLQSNGVDHEMIPQLKNKYLRPLYLSRIYKKYKPDVVISYLQSDNMAACLAQYFYSKAKLIVSERNTNQSLSKKDKVLFYLYKKADYIVPNSHTQHDFILKYYPEYKNKLRTITNFIDTDIFKPSKEHVIRENPLVLTVGRYTQQKNCLRFIEAVSKLKNKGVKAQFVWFGDKKRYPLYYKDVETLVKQLKLEDYLVLNDQSENIVSAYQNADVFCLPSIYEGYPNVVCEAMSCGLPLVCSNVSDTQFIMKEGCNGYLFNPLSVDDIAEKLEFVLSLSSDELKKMGEQSREIALQTFSYRSFIESYIELIEK